MKKIYQIMKLKENALLLHAFVFGLGLLKVAWIGAGYLAKIVFPKLSYEVNEWVLKLFFPEKRYELFCYIGTALILFVYYALFYSKISKTRSRSGFDFHEYITRNSKIFLTYLVVSLIVNIMLVLPLDPSFIGKTVINFLFLTWMALLLLPFYYSAMQKLLKNTKRMQTICYVLFFAVLAAQVINFSPFVFSKLKMANEYFNIPEETMIDGKYIDNSEYVNQNSLLVDHNWYDLEKDKSSAPKPKEGTFVKIEKTFLLLSFIQKNSSNYYYDDNIKALCVVGKMKDEERAELKMIMKEEKEKFLIDSLYDSNIMLYSEINKKEEEIRYKVDNLARQITDDEIDAIRGKSFSQKDEEFLKKNRFEMRQQVLNRWMIHHHNYILGPINEYSLGRNIEKIYMQYGYLNIVVMTKLLGYFGGINYQNYFKMWYSFYFIYFILFILLVFLLFKRMEYVLIIIMLAFGAINKMNFQMLSLGPGLNPVRHIFDLFIVGFLYMYLTKKKNKYYYLTMLSALFGILNNFQIGLFSLIALMITMIVVLYKEPKERSYTKIFAGAITLFAGLVILFLMGKGYNPSSHYYLEGLCGFPVDLRYVVVFIVTLCLGYVTVIKLLQKNVVLNYVLLFLLIYAQAMFLYFVWGATMPHLYNYSLIYVLAAAMLMKLFAGGFESIKRHKETIIAVLILVSLLFFGRSLLQFYTAKYEFDDVFKTHKTYEWNFEKAKFTSTMNPKYFEDSIRIVKKYSRGNGIYIISKYDNFVPFLAGKFSDMPYPDVQWYVITKKEVNDCINSVKEKKPEYLFVDTDINRSLVPDKISKYTYLIGYLSEESEWRVQRLSLLKDIFTAVKDDYEPVEQGYLITAYKRTAGR